MYQADAGFAVLRRGVRVVSYAHANFGLDEDLLQVPGVDHISISKAVAKTDTAYLAVFSFIHRTVKQTPVSPTLSPFALLAPTVHDSLLVISCSSYCNTLSPMFDKT